jgi:hypothetical protein
LAALDHGAEALPVLDSLAEKPAFAAVAATCRFVIYTSTGRAEAAKPYRDAAEKFKERVPAGSFWRRKIDTALSGRGPLPKAQQ